LNEYWGENGEFEGWSCEIRLKIGGFGSWREGGGQRSYIIIIFEAMLTQNSLLPLMFHL
jgi:hypothetical protein